MKAETLVMIPGLLSTEAIWAPQIEALSDRADVLTFDTSTKSSIREVAADILSQLPKTFALAGHSMGGYVALEMASQAPERVSRLALLNTSARQDGEEVAQRRLDFIDLAERGRFLGVTSNLFAAMVHERCREDEHIFQIVKTMAEEIGAEGFVRQQKANLGRADHRPTCKAITCPTLVLSGRQDAVVPLKLSEELATLMPGATRIVVENCGHLPTLEASETVTGALEDWLDG